jgi:hypothetical protein
MVFYREDADLETLVACRLCTHVLCNACLIREDNYGDEIDPICKPCYLSGTADLGYIALYECCIRALRNKVSTEIKTTMAALEAELAVHRSHAEACEFAHTLPD